MGRHGSRRHQPGRRLPAHGHQRRAQGLGAFRLRQDARLSLGHLPHPGRGRAASQLRCAQRRAGVAGSARRVPVEPAAPHRHPGRHRAGIGRAAAPSRAHLPVALRSAQPVPGQRRGRAPSVGDGVPAARLFRPRWPRGGRSAARAPLGRRRQSPDPGRVQREDARLAGVFHVHVLHRSRRQVPALLARRIGLRSAGAHDPVHADGGSAPHVRRRERRRPRGPALLRSDGAKPDRRRRQDPRAGRDRPADDPALPQFSFQRDDGPLRRRRLVERGDVLFHRSQGPLRRNQDRRRPSARERRLPGAGNPRRAARDHRGAGAQRAQRKAARRLHQGCRRRCRALEQDHRKVRRSVPAQGPAQGVQSQDRTPRRRAHRSGWQCRLRCRMGRQRRPLAPERRRSRVRRVADGPRRRAGQVRELDRPARARHQQPAGRLPVRPVQRDSALERRDPAGQPLATCRRSG